MCKKNPSAPTSQHTLSSDSPHFPAANDSWLDVAQELRSLILEVDRKSLCNEQIYDDYLPNKCSKSFINHDMLLQNDNNNFPLDNISTDDSQQDVQSPCEIEEQADKVSSQEFFNSQLAIRENTFTVCTDLSSLAESLDCYHKQQRIPNHLAFLFSSLKDFHASQTQPTIQMSSAITNLPCRKRSVSNLCGTTGNNDGHPLKFDDLETPRVCHPRLVRQDTLLLTDEDDCPSPPKRSCLQNVEDESIHVVPESDIAVLRRKDTIPLDEDVKCDNISAFSCNNLNNLRNETTIFIDSLCEDKRQTPALRRKYTKSVKLSSSEINLHSADDYRGLMPCQSDFRCSVCGAMLEIEVLLVPSLNSGTSTGFDLFCPDCNCSRCVFGIDF